MEDQLKNEFIEKYSKSEFDEVETLIEFALSCNVYKDDLIQGGRWCISQDVEKHNVLQYTHYITLSKEIKGQDDEEITLTYENGINNGTVLQDYSLEGSGGSPTSKTVEVLQDITLDEKKCKYNWWVRTGKELSELQIKVLQAKLESYKKDILKIYSNQSYDNYVTGGGTSRTDRAYAEQKERFHSEGLYWELVYEEIEAGVNFV